MRVAVDGAPHGARRAGPLGEAGEAVADRVTDEAVQGDPGLGPDAVGGERLDAPAMPAHDQAPDAGVTDQDVRAPAEPRQGDARRAREPQRREGLVGRPHFDQEVGRTPDPERREGGEGRLPPHAVFPERRAQRLGEVHHGMLPRQRRPKPSSARKDASNGRAGIADTEPKPRVAYSVPVRFRRLSRSRSRRTSYETIASRVV